MRNVSLVAKVRPTLQLAQQQARRPFIERVEVMNAGAEPVADLRIRVVFDPPVAAPIELAVGRLDPQAKRVFESGDIVVAFSTERLVLQQERVEGYVHFELVEKGEVFSRQSVAFAVLPHNHWSGLSQGPELLAAFVNPNTQGVAQWLERAKQVLTARRLSPSLEGYQGNSRERVLELASAIYSAVGAAGITYANPPASFETYGQKIRLPDQVFNDGLATCLDLAVGMAAAMEQIGLHPILVIQKDHAFAGVWLSREHPSDPTLNDAASVRKRHDLGELVVFDSSPACSGITFEKAVAGGRAELDKDDEFVVCVDLKAARALNIRPLPTSVAEARAVTERVGDVDGAADSAAMPVLSTRPGRLPDDILNESPPTRLDRWRNKLLDLSPRNRLIDLKDGKQVIPLVARNPGLMEDTLHQRPSLVIKARPGADSATEDDLRKHAEAATESGELIAALTESALNERAVELYRRSTAAERDSGHSPLYLTLGVLRWFESETSTTERNAPILLLPIQIVRDGVRGPYRIRRREDDAVVNPSMLKKLQSEFGVPVQGLDVVAFDDNGIDVDRTLQNVRQAIVSMPRFDVLPNASIAMLSFERILMYHDLQANLEALQRSPIVARLLDANAPALPGSGKFVEPNEIDARGAADDFGVVDSDSTQQAAVYSAVDGNSFVLQGPPGTGKSQTITNLVAQLVARNKTVLFVAEKRAALEVVHERLKRVGLGPFVLDAHSDRDDVRSAVIQQLAEPTQFAWSAPDGGWAQHAALLDATRNSLNEHVRRIHTPGPFGESLYAASGVLLALSATPSFVLPIADEPTREQLTTLEHAAQQMVATSVTAGTINTHPWLGFDPQAWNPSFERDVANSLQIARERIATLGNTWAASAPLLKVDSASNGVDGWAKAITTVLDRPPLRAALLQTSNTELDAVVAPALALLERRRSAAAVAEQAFTATAYVDPVLPAHVARLRRWANAFFLIAFFMLFATRRALRLYARDQKLLPNRTLLEPAAAAELVQQLDAQLAAMAAPLGNLFGPIWQGAQTNETELRDRVNRRAQLRSALLEAAATDEQRNSFVALATEADERLAPTTPIGRTLRTFVEAWQNFGQIRRSLDNLLVPRTLHAWGEGLSRQAATIETLQASMSQLRDWAAYRSSARQAEGLGLLPIVSALEAGQISRDQIADSLNKAVRTRWVERRISGDSALSEFQGARHDQLVDRFRSAELEAQTLARRHIQAVLAARLPDPNAPGPMETIRREVRKRRNHIAVRQLFTELRDVVQRLKPCVLMSPLSVARYLDPSLPHFDVVIFDEASQIPPWDAVGALARARQAIVVGDSKQLPPTTFFRKQPGEAEADGGDDYEYEDLESILDHCGASGFSERLLGWHYRSRHESLIAFSNQAYYRNRLNIFPSPLHNHPKLGLRMERVANGVYDRGGARTNRVEADAVVEYLVSFLRDPTNHGRSIGIVTFAMTQQELIENLVDEARRGAPELEAAFAAMPDTFFVKNLENVQGDERDVMLFSIGYARDAAGKLPMNFGPLNKSGGERRLNVAVTRAREQLIVFSTLQPEDIDLSRTGAEGVRDLKAFLSYARDGISALNAFASATPEAQHESPFEVQVAARLKAAGYAVHAQVGVAGYRIDLAVVDPRAPGAYLLAVECDGAQYHRAAAARDRDRLRQAVLERLGWAVHRIWSTDWWYNADRQMERLIARLRELETKAINADLVAAATASVPAAPLLPPQRDEAAPEATAVVWPANASPWPGMPAVQGGRLDIYDARSVDALMRQIHTVCVQCAPLGLKQLADHVALAWDVKVVNKRVLDRIAQLTIHTRAFVVLGDFVWPAGVAPTDFRAFRYAADAADRNFEDVCVEELVNALVSIVDRSVFLSDADAQRELARVFGIGRLGAAVKRTAQAAIDHALASGRLVRDGANLRAVS